MRDILEIYKNDPLLQIYLNIEKELTKLLSVAGGFRAKRAAELTVEWLEEAKRQKEEKEHE